MDLLLDVHCHSLIATHQEAEGTCDARPLEQGVDGDLVGSIYRSLDVEVREVRKLLSNSSDGRIDRDASGRNAILVVRADGAEVCGAQDRDPVILAPVKGLAIPSSMPVAALLAAEARKSSCLG